MLRRSGAVALLAVMSCASQPGDAVPRDLLVVIDRLPQCEYGVGYEHPLRIELVRDDGAVVATTFFGGTYTGAESLRVPLYAPAALPGRYTIRFGQCPSLLDDPAGAVACTDPDWVRRTRRRLRPEGMEHPQVVEYYRVRARCLPPAVAPGSPDAEE